MDGVYHYGNILQQEKNFRSDDVDNKGYGQGKPCLAAVVISEFINCVDWIHFDVTGNGVGMMCKDK
jgi:leucyl aminopeptidase